MLSVSGAPVERRRSSGGGARLAEAKRGPARGRAAAKQRSARAPEEDDQPPAMEAGGPGPLTAQAAPRRKPAPAPSRGAERKPARRQQQQEEQQGRKPTSVRRAKTWSPEVEEAFRLQQAGWRGIEEYIAAYGEPERWDNGYIRMTRVKENGYFVYWRQDRELPNANLHQIKIYGYD